MELMEEVLRDHCCGHFFQGVVLYFREHVPLLINQPDIVRDCLLVVSPGFSFAQAAVKGSRHAVIEREFLEGKRQIQIT
ncbi:hypothetical protein D3C73_781250 [compost metagenome]